MGNYSYLIEQRGCIIDSKKTKVLCALEGIKEYIESESKKLDDDNLGNFVDGWKIQGYWYEEFGKFLTCCLLNMKDLTEDENDNMLEMEEEQGFKFNIIFYLAEDTKGRYNPTIKIEYMPIDWREGKINQKTGVLEEC